MTTPANKAAPKYPALTKYPDKTKKTGKLNGKPVTRGEQEKTTHARPPNSMAIELRKNVQGKTVADTAAAVGGYVQTDHPHTYTHRYETRFGGKRYVVNLEIPILDSKDKENPSIPEASKGCEEMVTEHMKQLFAKGSFKPGVNLSLLFFDDSEGGIATLLDKDGTFDPTKATREDLKKNPNCVFAEDAGAKEISRILNLGKPEEILSAVKSQPTTNSSAKPQKSASPVNLENPLNRCFVNAPFLHLTDPLIMKDLKPEYFVDGENNPLYTALQGYAKQEGSKYDLRDLVTALKIDDTKQNDMDYVWEIFGKQLNKEKIPSDAPILSLFTNSLIISSQSEKNVDIATLIQEQAKQAWDPKSSSPSAFSVYISKVDPTLGSEVGPPNVKVESPLKVGSTVTLSLNGKPVEYDLVGYTSHAGSGENGHYTTSKRVAGKSWLFDDKKPGSRLLEGTSFEDNAQTAVFYVFHKKELPSVSAEGATNEPQKAKNKEMARKKVSRVTDVVMEAGSLMQVEPDCALVNPTDTTLDTIHPDIQIPNLKEQMQKVRAATGKARWFKTDEVEYSAGHVELTRGTKNVFHLVKPLVNNYKDKQVIEWVKAVLEKARKEGIYKVAFPLILHSPSLPSGKSVPVYDDLVESSELIFKAAEEFANDTSKKTSRITEVKIVLTPEQQKIWDEGTKILVEASKKQASQPALESTSVAQVEPVNQTYKHTTLVIETGDMPKELGQMDPFNKKNLATDLKAEFDKTSDEDEEVLFDFTKGRHDTFGGFDVGLYGYNHDQAIAIFYKQLRDFAETNDKPVTIRLKIPKGVKVPSKLQSLWSTPAAPKSP